MKIYQAVSVGVIFKGSNILPRWFIWKERKYNIKTIDYTWIDTQGKEKIIKFSVNDGTNSYELEYHTLKTHWKLNKICCEL